MSSFTPFFIFELYCLRAVWFICVQQVRVSQCNLREQVMFNTMTTRFNSARPCRKRLRGKEGYSRRQVLYVCSPHAVWFPVSFDNTSIRDRQRI